MTGHSMAMRDLAHMKNMSAYEFSQKVREAALYEAIMVNTDAIVRHGLVQWPYFSSLSQVVAARRYFKYIRSEFRSIMREKNGPRL